MKESNILTESQLGNFYLLLDLFDDIVVPTFFKNFDRTYDKIFGDFDADICVVKTMSSKGLKDKEAADMFEKWLKKTTINYTRHKESESGRVFSIDTIDFYKHLQILFPD